MDLRKLKKLIDLVQASGISELEVTEGEEKVRIAKTVAAAPQLAPAAIAHAAPVAPAAPAVEAAAAEENALPAGHVVTSPMVGTFYRASSLEAEPFAEVFELMHLIEILEGALGKTADKQMLDIQPGDVPATYADVDDLIRAINFPENAEDEAGFEALRRTLIEAARREVGPEVHDVLITELLRQES